MKAKVQEGATTKSSRGNVQLTLLKASRNSAIKKCSSFSFEYESSLNAYQHLTELLKVLQGTQFENPALASWWKIY